MYGSVLVVVQLGIMWFCVTALVTSGHAQYSPGGSAALHCMGAEPLL